MHIWSNSAGTGTIFLLPVLSTHKRHIYCLSFFQRKYMNGCKTRGQTIRMHFPRAFGWGISLIADREDPGLLWMFTFYYGRRYFLYFFTGCNKCMRLSIFIRRDRCLSVIFMLFPKKFNMPCGGTHVFEEGTVETFFNVYCLRKINGTYPPVIPGQPTLPPPTASTSSTTPSPNPTTTTTASEGSSTKGPTDGTGGIKPLLRDILATLVHTNVLSISKCFDCSTTIRPLSLTPVLRD